jgi:hypothetical protein
MSSPGPGKVNGLNNEAMQSGRGMGMSDTRAWKPYEAASSANELGTLRKHREKPNANYNSLPMFQELRREDEVNMLKGLRFRESQARLNNRLLHGSSSIKASSSYNPTQSVALT